MNVAKFITLNVKPANGFSDDPPVKIRFNADSIHSYQDDIWNGNGIRGSVVEFHKKCISIVVLETPEEIDRMIAEG